MYIDVSAVLPLKSKLAVRVVISICDDLHISGVSISSGLPPSAVSILAKVGRLAVFTPAPHFSATFLSSSAACGVGQRGRHVLA